MCYRYMANKLPKRAKWLLLAHLFSLCRGNPCDFLSVPIIPTIYQINVQFSRSRGLLECNKFSGYMCRRNVDDGFRVLEQDVAHHHSL